MKKRKMLKNRISVLLFLLTIHFGHSQKTIENPQYGASDLPGEITKIEILEDATILHFHIEFRAGRWISIPKGSCIAASGQDEKLMITKTEGIELGKRHTMDSTGVVDYKLFFPPVKKDVGKIDFIESNKGGTWYVYDLVIDEAKYGSVLPKELKGNWLKTDGSNLWAYGFYNDRAIIDKEIWNYKKVQKKRKYTKITLEKGGESKIIYAQVNEGKTVSFGTDKKQLIVYTSEFLKKTNPELASKEPYRESEIFKKNSATYSGVLNYYGKRNKAKTGMVHINNVFTGDQESYLVKIKEDGSFTMKFPMSYPQVGYVRFPGYNGTVFFEPGKETWQLVNSGKSSDVYFSGDLAQTNTDLVSLEFVNRNNEYYKIGKKIKELTLEEYKENVGKIHEKQIKRLNNELKKRFASKRAEQIKRLEIEYEYYQTAISYDMYKRDSQNSKIDKAYLSFITPDIYNNKLATITSSYKSFVNYLRFTAPMRNRTGITHPRGVELGEMLTKQGVVLTEVENEFINSIREFKIDNAASFKKEDDFRLKNKDLLDSYWTTFNNLFRKVEKEERTNLLELASKDIDAVAKLGVSNGVVFSKKEIATKKAEKNVLSSKEQKIRSDFFSKEFNEKINDFSEKYKGEIQHYVDDKRIENDLVLVNEFFDGESNWTVDVIKSQLYATSIIDNFSPLEEEALKTAQKNITDPFVKNYLEDINGKTIQKIEANKNATGYVLNATPTVEGDKVFDAIISKYKGKVVLVDFWATWCAPCRSSIKKMIPLKEEMKEQDVVFLYITNPSSPEKTYNNMIPEIKGEHYRVSNDEWNYLKEKFKITGIPHYALVNKEGKVVENKIRFQNNEDYKKAIEKHL